MSSSEPLVVSGISGRYPESKSLEEFWTNLLNGTEVRTTEERRWPRNHYLPDREALLCDEASFDADFFGLSHAQANLLPISMRMLHEVIFEAYVDAGIIDWRNVKTGLFLASSCTEEITVSAWERDSGKFIKDGMYRVAYNYNITGPIFEVDTACASSFTALECALIGIRTGQCDQAIVAAYNYLVSPTTTTSFLLLRMASKDGISKCLDTRADGYGRAESVCAIIIQKESAAKRIYGKIMDLQSNNDGYKVEGPLFPNFNAQCKLFSRITGKSSFDPMRVDYVEGHITGTPIGDRLECASVSSSFRPNSEKPLLMGCLKSNINHAEGASGLNALSKVSKIFQTGLIPANTNYEKMNPTIEALVTGLIVPVLSTTKFDGDLIPIFTSGIGGVNALLLFEANSKKVSDQDKILSELCVPRLVTFCNRTMLGLETIESFIKGQKGSITKHLLALFNDVSKIAPKKGFNFRGYVLLDGQQSIILRSFSEIINSKSPCFIFMPMFDISSDSLRQLLDIPFIEERLKSLNKKLSSFADFDLIKTLDSYDYNITSFIIFSTAIQITLYDLLTKTLKIEPTKIIGHSIGSIAAFYADGRLNDDQALLTSYCIGQVCSQLAEKHVGSMAYVNLPWNQIDSMKKVNIEIASHESEDWTTITGSKESVEDFISKIDDKVAVKIINSRNMAFNSSITKELVKKIETDLSKYLTNSQSKSSALVLTTDTLDDNTAKGINNQSAISKALTSRLLLKETLGHLSSDYIPISFGSYQKNLHGIDIIPLISESDVIQCNYSPVITHLYKSIGDLYSSGLNPSIENLYQPVQYPVPRETPSISHLIQWSHDVKFNTEYYIPKTLRHSVYIDMEENTWEFLFGHVIDGHALFPATGYLYLVQQAACFYHKRDPDKQAVEFQQVRFHSAVSLTASSTIKLSVEIQNKSFHVFANKDTEACVTGMLNLADQPNVDTADSLDESDDGKVDKVILRKDDFYKELKVRGYDYSGAFRGVDQAHEDGTEGVVEKTDHWISFTDSCLQVSLLGLRSHKLLIPVSLEYAYVSPSQTKIAFSKVTLNESESTPKLKVSFAKRSKLLVTDGFIIGGLIVEELRRRVDDPYHKNLEQIFRPFEGKETLPADDQDLNQKYMQHCLSSIETLRDIQSGRLASGPIESSEQESVDMFTSNKSGTLLRILIEIIKSVDGKTEQPQSQSVQHQLCTLVEKYSEDLLKDRLLFEPLTFLDRCMMNIVRNNAKSKTISTVAFNFMAIPTEIVDVRGGSFKETVFKRQFTYALTNNYAKFAKVAPGTNFIEIDPQVDDKISNSKHYDLIIARDKSTYLSSTLDDKDNESGYSIESSLKVIHDSLNAGGFCILFYRTKLSPVECELRKLLGKDHNVHYDRTSIEKCAKEAGFSWVGCKELEVEGFSSILLRRPFPVSDDQKTSIIRVKLDNYDWIDEIKKAAQDENHKIWLTASGYDNGLIALTECLLQDPNKYNVRCFYDRTKSHDDDINIPDHVLINDLRINVTDENNQVGCYFANPVDINSFKVSTPHCYADAMTKGDLSSIRWFESLHSKWANLPSNKLKVDVEMVTVHYGALNFRDVLVATGRVPIRSYPASDNIEMRPLLGIEYSGTDSSGNRVMGMCHSGGIGSTLLLPKQFTKISVPDNWTLAEAATIPVVYLTAYYGLIVRGNLRSGESVLIHAGSGGVGQAAISICLARGCQVFTTVGTKEKREFIKKRFPSIDDGHIGDSRSTSFEEMILKATDGQGVDIVLNSLSDDKLQASIRCLSDFGRFIEIGKYDIIQNTKLDSQALDPNKTFHAVCLAFLQDDALIQKIPARIKIWNQLITLIYEGIKSGEVRPLPSTIYEMDQIEDSFRFMAAGKHIGKVLIRVRDENADVNVPTKFYTAMRQTFFDPNKCYIITGGLGGLGLATAYWMCQRGATNFVLTSRSGIKTPYQQYVVDTIRNNSFTHTNVAISVEDCLTYESAERLIKVAESIAPIGGIFHYAMVLKDAIFDNQTAESFDISVKTKAIACRYLDQLSRSLSYKLDYFVCSSSAASEIGSIGQSNYCFANSSMEQICSKRRLDGHHGLAIQWGAIADVGIIADEESGLNEMIKQMRKMRLPLVLKMTDKLLDAPSALFTTFSAIEKQRESKRSSGSLKENIFKILGIPNNSKMDPDTALGSLGADSLMLIEIQQIIELDYNNSTLSVQDLRNMKVCELDEFEEKLKASSEN